MSARVLMNLLNELGKRDKMRGLPIILSLFRNEFNKFNNARARIYHMALRLLWRVCTVCKDQTHLQGQECEVIKDENRRYTESTDCVTPAHFVTH